MSVWIALWVVISLALLGFLVWSLLILYRQKKTWKAFAQKHKLRYKSNALMESPDVSGAFGDYKINFFTSEHVNNDARGVRKLIAIEIGLNSELPFDAAVASGGMVPIVKDIGFSFEVRPEHKAWNRAYIATGDSKSGLESYLKDDRVKALCNLMKIHNSWVVFICRKNKMLLRIDTPDPLDSETKLEKLTSGLVKVAGLLELDPGEFKRLKAEAVKSADKAAAAVLDDSGVDDLSGLSLEDDEPKAAVEDPVVEAEEQADEQKAESAESTENKKAPKPKS